MPDTLLSVLAGHDARVREEGAVSAILFYGGIVVFLVASLMSITGYESGRVNQVNLVALMFIAVAIWGKLQ